MPIKSLLSDAAGAGQFPEIYRLIEIVEVVHGVEDRAKRYRIEVLEKPGQTQDRYTAVVYVEFNGAVELAVDSPILPPHSKVWWVQAEQVPNNDRDSAEECLKQALFDIQKRNA